MEKIFNAKTLDEAKEMAVEEFKKAGVDEYDINFEIIEQPVKKLFGTKGEYRVRAIADIPGGEAKPQAAKTPIKTAQKAAEIKEAAPKSAPSADAGDYKQVIQYIENLLKHMGAEGFEINIKPTESVTVIDIVGDKLGAVIGRRGETLDALQYLAILANNRGADDKGYSRISIDCNGYREKRKETLEALAERTANKVIKQGRRVTLEPMNPYERRIIHSKVSEIDGVFSNSIGEEPYRKVVISANVPKRRSNEQRSGEQRGDRDRRGPVNAGRSYKQSNGYSTSFEREYKRVPSQPVEISQETADVEKNTSLYGKIEL